MRRIFSTSAVVGGVFLFCAMTNQADCLAEPLQITSPDGNVTVVCDVQEKGAFYSVRYKNKQIVAPSGLGLVLKGAAPLTGDFSVENVRRDNRDAEWTPLYGERSRIPDKYRELTVELREKAATGRRLNLVFRAYNEGAALRYLVPAQEALKEFTIASEATQFRFPAGSFCYEEHGTEGEYSRTAVEKIKPNCEIPLTIQGADFYASIIEAHVENYSRLFVSADNSGALVSAIRGEVETSAPFASPWRAIVVGERPGDLLERSYFILNLNPPNVLADTSWIKPGKVIREVTLSTAGGKACVDFAAARGLSYIEYDAGWYGHEYDDAADARSVNVDPKRNPKNDLDLQGVIEYARQKNIGVLVYVNRRALEKQLDEILPIYQKWGVKGLKFGFVNVGPQKWTNWLNDSIKKCAQYQMLVDVHDGYRPTGLSRTYPNLLTQEGVRGNEHMPTSRHNVTLPFTRSVAGAADYTVCYFNDRIKNSRAHQLAMSVAIYSPLQFLYWYDRPAQYRGDPEVEFFDKVPTIWDETRVLQGEIGEFASIARRSGEVWFVGNLTNEKAREIALPLNFLAPGKKYVAHLYHDGDFAETSPKTVGIKRQIVDSNTVLPVKMAANGGQAMRFVPATAADLELYGEKR